MKVWSIALIGLLRSSAVISSVASEEAVSVPLASQTPPKKERPLATTPNQKRELDLVQQVSYTEEEYTIEHTNNMAYWEIAVSDDGYTIVTVVNDPNDTSAPFDQVVRILKYRQSKWPHMRRWEQMGQDFVCQYSHSTVPSTGTVQWGRNVSLSGDGKVFAISTSGTSYHIPQVDRHLIGYTDVFQFNDDTKLWEARGQRLDGSAFGARVGDRFGYSVKLSRDGMGLLLATDGCYRKSSTGGGHDARTDRARGFEWNETTQTWDTIFSLDKWNGVVGPCASLFGYVDVLKSKDGSKWYYALSGYHHTYDSTYVFEIDRNSRTQTALGGEIDQCQFTQLLEDDNGDLHFASHWLCCGWGNTAAWRHHKFNRSTNSWQVVQTFIGSNDDFGRFLSLSSDGRFLAAPNYPDGFSNRIYEFNPNTLLFQELGLSGNYPIRENHKYFTILPSGDVITLTWKYPNNQETRFVLDPGVDFAGGGGDPHFNAFGGIFFTWQGHCDVILAKTPTFGRKDIELQIHVRTRRIRKWSAIDGVAFKVGNDVGEIDSNEGKLIINGAIVESLQTETFKVTKSKLKKKIMQYEFVFDENTIFEVKVNTRGQMIFVNLKGEYPEGTVGILGSPHNPGLFSRDGTLMTKKEIDAFVESWQIQDLDPQLFHERRHPQYPSKCLYQMEPTQSRGRRRLKETHTVTMEDATAACAAHPPGPGREFCVDDVYQTGNIDVAEEDFYG